MALNPFAIFAGRNEKRDALDALANAFFYGGTVSAAGVRVTPETALASVAVAACIEVRAETFASLPIGVYEKADRKRIPLDNHPVQRLLTDKPNDLMTGGELLRWKQVREDITGNAYLRIVWKNGRPIELWPLFGNNPQVRTAAGKIAYRYQGDEVTPSGDYSSKDIIHFKGPFLKNPFEAASPIDLVRDTIGLSIATEQFFGRFLNNGSHFPTYLETDNNLTVDDIKAIANSLKSTAGVLDAGKMKIFDRGLKVRQNTMSLKDADLSTQMRWYLEQICRIYRVPPQMVQDWTHGTYTNSEQAGLWLAQHTITPIAVDTERVLRKKLFVEGEEANYVRFNVDAILRGDYATRTAGYNTLINAGVLSRNEARAFEDLDPYDGGDEYLVPLNMTSASSMNTTLDTSARSIDETLLTNILEPVLNDALERIKIRAKQDLERNRTVEQTEDWAKANVLPALERALSVAGLSFNPTLLVDDAIKEVRAVSIEVPEFVQANAKRGIAYYEDGKGGDGLVPQTIRDARELAAGRVSETKIRKISPWIARHIVDLDAPQNSNSDDPNFPGAGLVAMLLWGGGSTKEGARRTADWAEREVEKLDAEA